MRTWMLLIAAVGCGGGPTYVSRNVFSYRADQPDWQIEEAVLAAPRAAHGLLAVPGQQVLVLGGDAAPHGVDQLVPALEVERCTIASCESVGRLAHSTEQPDVALAPDGSAVVADSAGVQIFDPATGTTDVLDISPLRVVETGAGAVVLGIEGARDPRTNVPGPSTYGVIRSRAGGLEPVAAPPAPVWVQGAAASDAAHVVVASSDGSALLDVAGGTWTTLPAVPVQRYDTLHVVRVGDGAVLAIADNARAAYLLSTATGTWTSVPVPSSDYIVRAIAVPGGGLVITDGAPGVTRTFRLSDLTWVAGPSAPPWSILDATTVLDDGTVISVGGTDEDFIADRSA